MKTTFRLIVALLVLTSIADWGTSFARAQTPAAPSQLSPATVKALQEALNKQGIAVKTDGVLDGVTREAVKKYQSQHHLPVTGEPDKATLDKLGVATQPGAAMPGGGGMMGHGMMPPGHNMMGSGSMGGGSMPQGQGTMGPGSETAPGSGMPKK
jgi:hypothetical protein